MIPKAIGSELFDCPFFCFFPDTASVYKDTYKRVQSMYTQSEVTFYKSKYFDMSVP